jgi:integrase
MNGHHDSTMFFLISKMLEGMKRKNPQQSDIRASISIDLLKRLIKSLHHVCSSHYDARLLSAAFSLAYFAMLRVSEISLKTRSDQSGHALQFNNVSFENNDNTLCVKISSSKTDQKNESVTLIIQTQSDVDICPVLLLQSYLRIRFSGLKGSNKLFVHFDGKGLTRYQFCSILQKCLQFCDIPLHIRSHSFRIGRATDMAKMGIADEQIKCCGRWNFVSYWRYIRL